MKHSDLTCSSAGFGSKSEAPYGFVTIVCACDLGTSALLTYLDIFILFSKMSLC